MSNVIQGSNQLSLTNEIGCGKYYENIVLYAHSTGALVAAMYGADNSSNNGSWRGAIDGYILIPVLELELAVVQSDAR